MLRKHVVIVGGGWAGMALARKLKKIPKENIRITVVADNPNFMYSAALYKLATGYSEQGAVIPIAELTADITNLKYLKAKVTHINRAKKSITLEGGQQLHYDYAVLALGSVTNYFGIPGLKEHSFGIKTPSELRHFRAHIHKELVSAVPPDKNYVVVGGGPTGVELSAVLATYLKTVAKRHGLKKRPINIELIEASARVLPLSNPRASKKTLQRLRNLGVRVHLKAKVEAEASESLKYNGKSIATQTVVWTAGAANSPFYKANNAQFALNERGKVIVDDHLRVDHYTYVIGDNAATPYSGLGLTAVHNAKFVAKDINKKLKGQLHTPFYKPLVPATVVPAGSNWGIFQYRKLIISGYIGSLLRAMADLVAYHDIAGWARGTSYWLKSGKKDESCPVCKKAIKHENWVPQSSYD
jgi:NADH:ubiquinone reductase (H+-translocating)